MDDLDTSFKFIINPCCESLRKQMHNYGDMLTCPVCNELFTHPVLLPCQHSMCFGCARFQIMIASEKCIQEESDKPRANSRGSINSPPSFLDTTGRTISESTPTKTTKKFGNYHSMISSPRKNGSITSPTSVSSYQLSDSADVTIMDDGNTSMADSAIVLSTNDLLHFGNEDTIMKNGTSSNTKQLRSSFKNFKHLTSPTRKMNYSVSTPKGTSSRFDSSSCKSTSSLRRSSSTTALSRSGSIKSNGSGYKTLRQQSRISKLYCPTCQCETELGRLGISGLFRNFALEAIVERFRSAAKAAMSVRCGYCKPPANDATKSCTDCQLSYCNECFKLYHTWGTAKAQHHYTGPTNNFSRPKVLLCPKHGTEPVNMYCNKCNVAICKKCKSGGGSHANHSISSVKIAYKEARARLCSSLQTLQGKKQNMEEAIEKLQEDVSALDREESEIREEIHSVIDGLHNLLEKKRTELLAKSDAIASQKRAELRGELYNLHNNVLFSSVMAFAEEVMREEDPAYFLQTIAMVETRIAGAIEHLSKIPSQARDKEKRLIPLHLDENFMKEKMQEFDFVKAPPAPLFTGDENDFKSITWSPPSDDVEYYEVKYGSTSAKSPAFQRIYKTCITPPSDGTTEMRVRAVNKAGAGPWSELKQILSARFPFRFTALGTNNNILIGEAGYEAKIVDESNQQYHVLTGDIGLWGGEQSWVIHGRGDTNFKLLVGVADMNFENHKPMHGSNDLHQFLHPESSALLQITGCSSRLVEHMSITNQDRDKGASSVKSENILNMKPLKQLKNTIFRRSSFGEANGKPKFKYLKSKKGSGYGDLTRSFSTTELNGVGSPRRQLPICNKTYFVGQVNAIIKIAVKMQDTNKFMVQFYDMSCDHCQHLCTKMIHTLPPICPFVAMAGRGHVELK